MSKSLEIEKRSEGPQVVFTQRGTDLQAARNYKTGMAPAIYGNWTYYVTIQKLTLEMLKETSDSKGVLEVTGEYIGSSTDEAASRHFTQKKTHSEVE